MRQWLRSHGYDGANEGLCAHVFKAAKTSDHTFAEGDVHTLCRAYGAKMAAASASVADTV